MSARRWLRVTVAATGVVGLATLARADAPSDQYGLFNISDQVITDRWTTLIWQRYAPAAPVTFDGAAAYCGGLSLYVYTTGWRVPSYKEMLTLVDETPHTEYENGTLVDKMIDGNAFPQTVINSQYWTSSPYPPHAGWAYDVSFHNGFSAGDDMLSTHYVRCVHD